MEALLKAYLEASAFILDPANKKAVLPILAKDMKLDKEEDIELAYDRSGFIDQLYQPKR